MIRRKPLVEDRAAFFYVSLPLLYLASSSDSPVMAVRETSEGGGEYLDSKI